ncbi:MAG TPA: tRNA (guanosine(37)-N1)-methyltransferase TrmD [Acidimicrobiia bacterium]|nr:tRNA (guanosine(37)-N1)-methyltransferase TrmD [Acidimicrobiia bacterium]
MRITVLTLFPDFFTGPLSTSMVERAIRSGGLSVELVDFRHHGKGVHRQVDDAPFGGGPGMVLMAEPLATALEPLADSHRIYLSPAGRPLDQAAIDRFASIEHLTILCGRYEGVDQRVIDQFIDEEVSLGDFVLTGGEVAAAAIIEGIARLLPGVVGNPGSLASESFRQGFLEEPHYTRPSVFRGHAVPDVLLSGDHARIDDWRQQQRRERTARLRPDLMGISIDPDAVVIREDVPGSPFPAHLMYVETWDGLYAPVGLRYPAGEGPFPLILLALGNGGGGMAWIREAISNRGYIMDRLLEAGYACAWLRYRTEVELGYHQGGPLVRDMRQGRELFNRSPLEYEDEIAIIEHVKTLPSIDPDRIGLIGVSHGGEMVLKITSEYHGVAAAVASEPASHEFLALTPDETAFVNPETKLRNIEDMQMGEVEKVRSRIDRDVAHARIVPCQTPILVMGRDSDHLQGIFRTSYELLAEADKDVEWVSFDHPLHGYIYPLRGTDGQYPSDPMADEAIATVVEFLNRRLGS